jgi:branched-chain amino acid transport system ATP-binding protein
MAQQQQASLSTRDLTIRFGGHVAVNTVTADFYPGTLTVIVGPNGAGKTTYFNLVSGQLAASSGSVHVAGRDVTRLGPAARTRLGVGRAFQLTNLFPHLTVLENVRLAVQSRAGIGLNMFSVWFGHKAIIERAQHYLERVSMIAKRDVLVGTLPHGDQTVLLVEHKMDVVRSLADRIVVLHNGALVADGEPSVVMQSKIVQEAYLGTPELV